MSWSGDEPETVVANRRRYLQQNDLRIEDAVGADQVHGAIIHQAARTDAGRGMLDKESRIPGTDALITNERGLVLTTLHADCAPVFYFDREHNAIGLAHAGWRGIVAGLPGEMMRRMQREFHSDPRTVEVAVGPTVCTARYDVDETLAERFIGQFGPEVVMRLAGHARPHLDLVAAITMDLLRAGLSPERIPLRPPCTASDPRYSSYRRDGAPVHSMMAWLRLA